MAVFEQSFINDMHRKYRRLSPFQRPLVANVALDDQRAEERARINGWVRRLAEEDQQKIVPQLRHPNHFLHTYGEVAAAQPLIDAGCELHYEEPVDGVIPKWSCLLGDEVFMCDVFTAGLPDATYLNSVMQLAGRLSAIPQPYLVRLDAPPDFALDPPEQKKVCAAVAAWLAAGVDTGDDWSDANCTVSVLGPARDRVEVVITDDAYIVPKPETIAATMHERSKMFAAAATPLLIAVVKHPRAEADVVVFQEGVLGTASYRRVERTDGRLVSALWRQAGGGFDRTPELSAALWLHPYRPGGSDRLLLTNPEATRPLPERLVLHLDSA